METWLDERLGRPKLLLVDDQPMNIRVLHQLFRYECDVHMATGGEQAIEVCKALLPDLILLDVVMEGMDGHEVCRRLKADPLTQDIPIIFLSANGEEDDEAIGLELGAVDYIRQFPEEMFTSARCFHTCGITLALDEKVRETAVTLMRKFKEHGTLISFDVKFRGNLWSV